MATPESEVKPHFSSVPELAQALFAYADGAVRKKDEARCSELLLLFGPVAFSYPEVEVIDSVIRNRTFVSIKVAVFVAANRCYFWETNMA